MATRNQDTVTNILQTISDLRGESTTNTDSERIRAVQRAYDTFAKRRFWQDFLVRLATTTGDGGNDYAIGSATLPMRKDGLTEVYVGGTTEAHRYSIVDYHKYQNLINQNSSERVAYEWYDQENDAFKVHINPAVDTGETIYYSYYFMPAKITTTTDVIICPDLEVIVRLALGDIYESEEETELADANKNVAEQIINELTSLENAPNVNQLKSMGAIENQVRQRGIGSY